MAISFPPVLFTDTLPSMYLPISATPVLTQDDLKCIAAYKAVEFVESGMVVGLGTRSTAVYAVARIADLLRLNELSNIVGVPTSIVTADQAHALGIPLSDLDPHPVVGLAINGADKVNPALNLVKGSGGSLLGEKMDKSVARQFVIIIDELKLVHRLRGSGLALPLEIVKHCPS